MYYHLGEQHARVYSIHDLRSPEESYCRKYLEVFTMSEEVTESSYTFNFHVILSVKILMFLVL